MVSQTVTTTATTNRASFKFRLLTSSKLRVALVSLVFGVLIGSNIYSPSFGGLRQAQRHATTTTTTAKGTNDVLDAYLLKTTGVARPDSRENCNPIAILVQGEAENFNFWQEIWLNQSYGCNVTLFYASFDKPLSPDEKCVGSDHCHTAYIPQTTWTQGRNHLAKMVYWSEIQTGRKFTYWLFCDDDADVKFSRGILLSSAGHWTVALTYLSTEAAEAKAPVVSWLFCAQAAEWRCPDCSKYILSSQFDAVMTAFHRDAVPYLLPYVFMKPGTSEWLSQAAQFWVMERCFRVSSLAFLDMCATNGQHRDYPRGLNSSDLALVLKTNFASYYNRTTYYEHERVRGQLESYHRPNDLKDASLYIEMATHATAEYCAPFKQRFEEWVASWIREWPPVEIVNTTS